MFELFKERHKNKIQNSEYEYQLQKVLQDIVTENDILIYFFEWNVKEGLSQYGIGDFFCFYNNSFHVVEAKIINCYGITGKTRRNRKNRNRNKVKDQAKFYALALQHKLNTNLPIFYYTLTEENFLTKLGSINNSYPNYSDSDTDF